MIELELPLPPSVNHYWRRVGSRTLISRGGRAFRRQVCSILAAEGVRPMDGRLEMTIDVYPPDRRRRDLDNLQKGLLDALAHGGAYLDDSQIDRLVVQRRRVARFGKVRVRIDRHRERPDQSSRDLPKPRTCLKCDRWFDSEWAGNRICPRCTQLNARLEISEAALQKQRGKKWHNGELMSGHPDDDSDSRDLSLEA